MVKILRLYKRLVGRNINSSRKLLLLLFLGLGFGFLVKKYILSDSSSSSDLSNSEKLRLIKLSESIDFCKRQQCPENKFPYFLKSTTSSYDSSAVICFDGKLVVGYGFSSGQLDESYVPSHHFDESQRNAGRHGVNLVVVNGISMKITGVRNFDTHANDTELLNYLKNEIQDGHIILLTTEGDASENLQLETRKLLSLYGSSSFERLNYHDQFVLLGWKGLGSAYEKFANSSDEESNEITGCLGRFEGVTACGISKLCPHNKYRFHIKSGLYIDKSHATICYNGKYLIGDGLIGGRGVNMVVVNERTMQVVDVKNFDIFSDDDALQDYLKHRIQDFHIILLATEDEASQSLQPETRRILNGYGSTTINKLQFRDQLIMVGQKGLSRGSAIEKFASSIDEDALELTGCLGYAGVGVVHSVQNEDLFAPVENISLNCNVENDCGPDAFPVRLFSGIENTELPKICLNGKYVMESEVGRGINVVIVDPKTVSVVKSGRFDTYEQSNTTLVKFLESLKKEEIVLAVTHDEAAMRLTSEIRKAFESLGSFYIQKLAMRDSWCFVGQQGLKGRSPIEELEFAPLGAVRWSDPIDKKVCVPKILSSSAKKFSSSDLKVNADRMSFCKKYSGYGEFCSDLQSSEPLLPALLQNPGLIGNSIFNIPIIVIPGNSKMSILMQLQSILTISGIKTDMVLVFYDAEYSEFSELIRLFGFQSEAVLNMNVYEDRLLYALSHVWKHYPDEEYVMVFEEDVLATKHYLDLMAQCLPALGSDESLVGISAWNENGYLGTSTMKSLVYRTEIFPGFGFLLKKSFYNSHMENNLTSCCRKRVWEGWSEVGVGIEMIVPDVSFVIRRPFETSGTTTNDLVEHLFNRPRMHHKGSSTKIENSNRLQRDLYEEDLDRLLSSAIPLKISSLHNCSNILIPSNYSNFVIYYEQESQHDEVLLLQLCRCFNLFSLPGHRVRGRHRGLIRFSRQTNQIFFVGSSTEYYRHKPKDHKSLQKLKWIKYDANNIRNSTIVKPH